MTDAKLEDAEPISAELTRWADDMDATIENDTLRSAAALLRRIPEIQQQLKEQQQWATARHSHLESQLRDQVDKRVELHRQLAEWRKHLAEAQGREEHLRQALQRISDTHDGTEPMDLGHGVCVAQARAAIEHQPKP
jgi:chromosome segregation ATPase